MKNIVFVCFAFLVFQSCTTLNLRLPSARLESPETNGHLWRTGFGGWIAGDHEVTVVSDAGARPPVTNIVSVDKNEQSSVYLNMGVASFIDLEFRTGFAGDELLAKIQFLGANALDSKPGNFSMAATFGIGGGNTDNSGNQAYLFGPADANWTAKASYASSDVALILGYHATESLLVFGGPFYTKYNAKASIHQDAVVSSGSPEADYNITQAGSNTGANIALKFSFAETSRWSFTLEGVYSTIKWDGSATSQDATGSISIGYLY